MTHLVLISDSTGDLGEHVVRAMMSQFPKGVFTLHVYRFVSASRELSDVFREVTPLQPIIFHTTLVKDLKKRINEAAAQQGFPVHDITGGAMAFLEQASGYVSSEKPASLHELNEEYDRRIAALNFTVDHDDAMGVETLEGADVILCGVSRTSKTPTSIYLANKGFKVANIPIIKGIPFPPRLTKKPSLPVCGLEIDADRLREIRLRRAQDEKIPFSSYTDLNEIKQELMTAKNLFLELGCPVIDVTHYSIEEVAALIEKKMILQRDQS